MVLAAVHYEYGERIDCFYAGDVCGDADQTSVARRPLFLRTD